jgi:hypothetical protein
VRLLDSSCSRLFPLCKIGGISDDPAQCRLRAPHQ